MGNFIFNSVENDIIIKCSHEELIKDFFKDYVIIWHDPNSNSEENQDHKAQLEEFCKVLTFTEWERAKDYIQDAKEVCHVLTSGKNGELLVNDIWEKDNVQNIYIFCGNKEYHSTWAKNYPKITCVENRIETILNKIQQNLVEWRKEEDSLKLNLPAFAPIFNDSDKSQMNHLHLYLKMIPNFQNREQAKSDFVSLSKKIYSHSSDMKLIEEFEQSYNAYKKEQTLRWYGKESFLYKMTNKCLRMATSDSIQYCRLPLKDIESAIREQYQKKSKNFNGLLFRGSYMSEQEWLNLKANLNREIEMHGFLSVSKDKNVGLSFVRTDPSKKVFITIIVPKGPNEEGQGFAEIDEYSSYPQEKEILFNVRSRFTVLETEDETSELPYRHLVLLYGAQGFRKYITEQNPVQKILIPQIENLACSICKEHIFKMPEKYCFVPIVKSTEQIYYCKKCFDSDAAPLLYLPITDKAEKTSEIQIKGCILMNINKKHIPFYGYNKCCDCQSKKHKVYFLCTDCCEGNKQWCENCFERASECRESGHKIILETSPFSFWCEKMSEKELNHLKFQNDLVEKNLHLFQQGQMYFDSHKYEKAKEYFSHYIQKNEAKVKHADLATAYNHTGLIYKKQGLYKKALEYHLKALEMFQSVYEENHDDIAAVYQCVGNIYNHQTEYGKAMKCYLESLKIYQSIYEESHPCIANVYGNIANVLENKGKLEKASEYHFKALEIRKLAYGENHPYVAISYNDIGNFYIAQNESEKALEYHLKSLEIDKGIFGENHPNIAASYNNLGSLHDKKRKYQEALEYYSKALHIYQSVYEENHPNIATCYNNIGMVKLNEEEYKEAEAFLLKALKIREFVNGENHPHVATCYNNLGLIYFDQKKYEKSGNNFLKALEIRKLAYGENHPDVDTLIRALSDVSPDRRILIQKSLMIDPESQKHRMSLFEKIRKKYL